MSSFTQYAQTGRRQPEDIKLWEHLSVEWIDVLTGDCWLEPMEAVANSMMAPWPTVAVPGASSRPIRPDELMVNNTQVSHGTLHILSLLLDDDHDYVQAIFNAAGMEGPPDTPAWRARAHHVDSAKKVTMTCVLTESEMKDGSASVIVGDGPAGGQ